jgi:superfamily II DNA or RNA helicase
MKNDNQIELNFNEVNWPSQEEFPLNLKRKHIKVKDLLYGDIENSTEFIIVTGFTSLSNLIDFFGEKDFDQLNKVKILIGFEPNIRGRRKYPLDNDLPKEVKEYWLKRKLSIIQGGAVINLVEKINNGWIEFRFRNKLHAKLYVGDNIAYLGSSNFSNSGLKTQEEANIRVKNSETDKTEQQQFQSIKKIANNYYNGAKPYNSKIIELLENLIKNVSWEEALARAIVEILEGEWLTEYKNILAKLNKTNLWPTQWKGLAQAVSIVQNHSNVLIADPTGAGKTKLCTSLVLSLQHWLYEIGKNYRTNSLVICPPLVVPKWESEFRSLSRINDTQISMGLLSNASGKNKLKIIDYLKICNILTIDEAHNYLSPNTNRTNLIKNNNADYKILVTATPISKKVEDLLRLIELLDIDNLTDEDFITYQELMFKPLLRHDEDNIKLLRKFISKFTVRRTKKALNKEINKNPKAYLNKLLVPCKFPTQIEKTYKTKETESDKRIVTKIDDLASKIKGVSYLTTFNKPKFEISKDESLEGYIKKRISSGRALSIYMIRSALRSSHVALVEHAVGSEEAMKYFDFEGKKNKTGNKIDTILKIIEQDRLPRRNKIFKEQFFPDWLIDKGMYIKACYEDLDIYKQISGLAKELSGEREKGKVQELINIGEKHANTLAFDSTVITLHYFRKIFKDLYPEKKILVASGDQKDKDSKKVLEVFHLESTSTERYVALCSDKMSESIDLQKASCVVLLDLPSVLRIVEQRIGRVDRMDSLNKSIEIYWPDDSKEYSLNADSRLVHTNEMANRIYGSNFNVPEQIKQKHFEKMSSTSEMIKEYKEFVDKDETWEGLHDSFQSIVDLKEGDKPLISESVYNKFLNVKEAVKTRVSFLESNKNWCFLAFRGEKSKSPKWYFIDNENTVHTDFTDICDQLRGHITKESDGLKWNDKILKKYIQLFKEKEIELLPPKKKRALKVAEAILKQKLRTRSLDKESKQVFEQMLYFLKPNLKDAIDYERLAEEWITILQPLLNQKRELNRRRKKIFNLSSLISDAKKIEFEIPMLQDIIHETHIVDDIDNKIASCIIGVKETTH